ncbi:MAG TPA: electron transfer flavoprotein subunit alpha/FixB family protein, partial [Firmicutes bacterium]|nr:electron transfer flavoprotein subunit alpha/FixB family protein [Bacillota bacterium]
LDEQVYCCVVGPSGIQVDELIFRGADKVFYVTDDDLFELPEVLTYAKNIVRVIEDVKPEICLFGATSFGRSLAP